MLRSNCTDGEKITLKYICENFSLSCSEKRNVERIKKIKRELADIRNKAIFREKEIKFRDFEFCLLVSEIKCDITIKRYSEGIRYYFVMDYFGSLGYYLSDIYPCDSEINRINACENLYSIFYIEIPTRARYTKRETEEIQRLLSLHFSVHNSLIEHVWKRKAGSNYRILFCTVKDKNLTIEYIELTIKDKVFRSSKYPQGILKSSVEFYKQALNDLYCQSISLLID